jgi:hypothetical protein
MKAVSAIMKASIISPARLRSGPAQASSLLRSVWEITVPQFTFSVPGGAAVMTGRARAGDVGRLAS